MLSYFSTALLLTGLSFIIAAVAFSAMKLLPWWGGGVCIISGLILTVCGIFLSREKFQPKGVSQGFDDSELEKENNLPAQITVNGKIWADQMR